MEPQRIVPQDLRDLGHSVASVDQGLLAGEEGARALPAPQCRAGEEVMSN